MLGHSSVQLTLDTYSHLLPDLKLKERAAARLDGLLRDDEDNCGQNYGQDGEKVVSRLGIVQDDASVALSRGVRLRRCAASARQPSRGLPSRSSRFGLTRVSEGW